MFDFTRFSRNAVLGATVALTAAFVAGCTGETQAQPQYAIVQDGGYQEGTQPAYGPGDAAQQQPQVQVIQQPQVGAAPTYVVQDGASPEVVYVDSAPVAIESYPVYYYGGYPAYLYGDRWYYNHGGRWGYFRGEPGELYRTRAWYGRTGYGGYRHGGYYGHYGYGGSGAFGHGHPGYGRPGAFGHPGAPGVGRAGTGHPGTTVPSSGGGQRKRATPSRSTGGASHRR